jgi:hypothetical protein
MRGLTRCPGRSLIGAPQGGGRGDPNDDPVWPSTRPVVEGRARRGHGSMDRPPVDTGTYRYTLGGLRGRCAGVGQHRRRCVGPSACAGPLPSSPSSSSDTLACWALRPASATRRARADVITLDKVKAEGCAAADWTGERHRSNSPNPIKELVARPQWWSRQGWTRIFTAVSLWLIRVSSPWSTTSARSMRAVMNGLRSTLPSWTSLMVSGWSLT